MQNCQSHPLRPQSRSEGTGTHLGVDLFSSSSIRATYGLSTRKIFEVHSKQIRKTERSHVFITQQVGFIMFSHQCLPLGLNLRSLSLTKAEHSPLLFGQVTQPSGPAPCSWQKVWQFFFLPKYCRLTWLFWEDVELWKNCRSFLLYKQNCVTILIRHFFSGYSDVFGFFLLARILNIFWLSIWQASWQSFWHIFWHSLLADTLPALLFGPPPLAKEAVTLIKSRDPMADVEKFYNYFNQIASYLVTSFLPTI